MPALSGQLRSQVNPWGKKKLQQIVPQAATTPRAQLGGEMAEYGEGRTGGDPSAGYDEAIRGVPSHYNGTESGKRVSSGNYYQNAPTNNPAPIGTKVQYSNQGGQPSDGDGNGGPGPAGSAPPTGTTPPRDGTTSPPAPPGAPYVYPTGTKQNPGDPPAGVLPGTPSYNAWLTSLPEAPPPPPPPTGDPANPNTPATPTGITIKGRTGGTAVGKTGFTTKSTPDFNIPEEMLGGLSPKQREELTAAAAKGTRGMAQWIWSASSQPELAEISQYLRSAAMDQMGKKMLRVQGKKTGGFNGGPGNTGIQWMDNKYADNMWARDPENPANQPQEPPPASGDGTWILGDDGMPTWSPGGPQIPPNTPELPYGDPPELPYGDPNMPYGPGFSPWKNTASPWTQMMPQQPPPQGGNPWDQWMQQQFMQQYGMR